MTTEQERLEQELAETRRLIRCKTLEKCPNPQWKLICDETIEHKGQNFNRKLWVAVCGGSVRYTEDLREGKRVYNVERFELKPESWVKEKALTLDCSRIVSDTYDTQEEAIKRVEFHKESIKPFWWKVKGKSEESKMEDLTLITEEKEYEPGYSNPETTVENNYNKELEQLRTDLREGAISEENYKRAVMEVLERKHAKTITGSNPGVYTIDGIEVTIKYIHPGVHEVSFLAPKELSEETLDKIDKLIKEKTGIASMGSNPTGDKISTFHSLMLHAVAEMYGPGGIVIDEAKARATPCSCVEYKPGKYWCTSPGVVGALTDEQEKIYCNPREVIDKPGIKERMAKWQECVTKSREAMPPVDGQTRLEIYLDSMSKCLTKAGLGE